MVGAGVAAGANPAHALDLILHSVCNVVFSAMIFCVYTLIVGFGAGFGSETCLAFPVLTQLLSLAMVGPRSLPHWIFVCEISFPVSKGGIV